MRVLNHTPTRVPTDTVKAICAFVCPPGVAGTLEIKRANGYPYRGLAHTTRRHATVWIGDASQFPQRGSDKKKLKSALNRWRKIKGSRSYTHWYEDGKVARVTSRLVRPAKPGAGRGGYLPRPALGNQIEGLVFVIAHELRHLWQARVPRGRRVWNARGQFSERDADAYAYRMLRAWRRGEGSDTPKKQEATDG